ncbi:hypothetical protein ACXJY6_07030 [Vibrio sp. RC27]
MSFIFSPSDFSAGAACGPAPSGEIVAATASAVPTAVGLLNNLFH